MTLFEHVRGNEFRLIKENTATTPMLRNASNLLKAFDRNVRLRKLLQIHQASPVEGEREAKRVIDLYSTHVPDKMFANPQVTDLFLKSIPRELAIRFLWDNMKRIRLSNTNQDTNGVKQQCIDYLKLFGEKIPDVRRV